MNEEMCTSDRVQVNANRLFSTVYHTHFTTNFCLFQNGLEKLKFKFVDMQDIVSADLLSHFKECFAFVDEALQNPQNKVLIHW